MRFDELILPEDAYPSAPRESKPEWLLMYSRGIPNAAIARWCRVEVRRVIRAVNKQILADPDWFGRCWRIHDQPVAGTAAHRRYAKNFEQTWWERYAELARYMRARGGVLPRQNDGAEGQKLYRWIEGQRRRRNAGTLSPVRNDAMNELGEWLGAQRGTHEDWWDQRLEEVRQFHAEAGRLPNTDRERHPDEGYLSTWLVNQRILHRRGQLRPSRRERLDKDLPGWFD